MYDLKNKVALVTGASRGIGRASAKALAEAGARVLVHYGRAADKAHSRVAEIGDGGGQAEALSADLATPHGAVHLAVSVRPSESTSIFCSQRRHFEGRAHRGTHDGVSERDGRGDQTPKHEVAQGRWFARMTSVNVSDG